MEDPRSITPRSIMPAYPHLMTQRLDMKAIQDHVDAMAMLGVPYGDAVNHAPEMAKAQAAGIAASLAEMGAPKNLEDREIVALIAYLQRLGTDIKKPSLTLGEASSDEGR
jgi:cytochrome c oxidase cbb3-type subunit I/II